MLFTAQPKYPFLANPPPQRKAAPAPIHSLSSSHFRNNIAAWAAHVQPGSPAPLSPISPRLSRSGSSTQRRASMTNSLRRSSISHSKAEPGSQTFVNILEASPTSPKNIDLTALGYTAVFVHFPNTPTSASPYVRSRRPQAEPDMPTPLSPLSKKEQPGATTSTLRRLCSIANITSRARSKSVNIPSATSSKPTSTPGAGATTKKAHEPKKTKHVHVRPPPLANDLALLQFVDGGSIEGHAKRVMRAQAKAAAGSHYMSADLAVGDVYRDEKGAMWWDQDEEFEYAHLLNSADVDMYDYEEEKGMAGWIQFDSPKREGRLAPPSPLSNLEGAGDLVRRESVSTQDSDLDVRYVVKPSEEDGVGAISRAVPGLSVLAVPLRSKTTAKHLRKPEFLVDLAAFGPRSPGPSSSFAIKSTSAQPSTAEEKSKSKARKRPAPLKIIQHSPSTKKPSNPALPTAGLPDTMCTARREFINDTFVPVINIQEVQEPFEEFGVGSPKVYDTVAGGMAATTPTARRWGLRLPQTSSSTVAKKPSRLDLRAVFGSAVRN
ncbi:hypothetical protein AMATHDRAFT_145563 [Amanita thiersii Skay4041]|uniref:Uncharacterized protein n=1 Tax=Amanita thiersii Skay4041 TaxID=703135 RepID=A0A2A9NPP7_9AGAR|nr:hypothetical protein AMATHDRAFT_145563 [Amanita thiersii Skay4041]